MQISGCDTVIPVMPRIFKSFPPVPIHQPFLDFEAEHCAEATYAQLQVGRTQQTQQTRQAIHVSIEIH